MHVDYSGGVEVKIDADLVSHSHLCVDTVLTVSLCMCVQVFDKSAYVAVKVLSVKGRVRVRFSRLPSTHWSFTFYEVTLVWQHLSLAVR